MLKTEGILALMGAILAEYAYIINELVIPIGERGIEAAIGSGVILATVGVLALIVAGLAKIDAKDLLKGGIAVAGIGVVLWTLSKTMDP